MNNLENPASSLARLVLDSNVDAIVVFDASLTILEWNRMAADVYGKARQDVLGRPLTEAIPSLQGDKETMAAIHLATQGVRTFVPSSAHQPHRANQENHYVPLRSEQFSAVMNTGHDVAHRIKAELQLQALNRQLEMQYRHMQRTSAELASLTSISSNNIKQPLRQIYTAVEHLIQVEAGRLSNSGKAAFRRIQSSLSRMDLLLDDILSLTGISTLEKPAQVVHLGEIMGQVVEGLKNKIAERGVSVTVGDLCTVRGHAEQLRLLFHHLLVNAIKFNEKPAPTISVRCETVYTSRFPDVAYNEQEYYRVSIADNGEGFAQENPAEVFTLLEKFSTGQQRQTGAGLVIASKVMDVHDGFIQAESIPGEGAYFHCYFPVPGT